MERQLKRHTIDRIGNPKCITDFCRRFFISNSRQFRQLRKLSSIQCRSSLVVKNGLGGWEWNPRPQQGHKKFAACRSLIRSKSPLQNLVLHLEEDDCIIVTDV